MNKTEWLSLKLHSERVSELVSKLKEEDSGEYQLVSELESELTSMRIMTLLVRSQICCSPVEIRNQEVSF